MAAVAAAALPSLALVAPATAAHGRTSPSTSTVPNAAPKTTGKHKGHNKLVAYVVRGTLSATATATSASLSVTSGNANAAAGLGKLSTINVTLGPKTHITKRGVGKATFADLKTGDRVVARWKVAKGTTLAGLPAASRVSDRGPLTGAHAPKTPAHS